MAASTAEDMLHTYFAYITNVDPTNLTNHLHAALEVAVFDSIGAFEHSCVSVELEALLSSDDEPKKVDDESDSDDRLLAILPLLTNTASENPSPPHPLLPPYITLLKRYLLPKVASNMSRVKLYYKRNVFAISMPPNAAMMEVDGEEETDPSYIFVLDAMLRRMAHNNAIPPPPPPDYDETQLDEEITELYDRLVKLKKRGSELRRINFLTGVADVVVDRINGGDSKEE